MFGLNALDVAIGVAFVYLLLSLICTTVNEWIAGILQWRGKTLADAISVLLTGVPAPKDGKPPIVQQLYDHPLLASLRRGTRDPSYIPPRTFARALIETLAGGAEGERLGDRLLRGAEDAGLSHLAKSLRSLGVSLPPSIMAGAREELEAAEEILVKWFDDTMDRARGWYRRRAQIVTISVAAAVTLFANADTFQIVRALWANPALREQIVAEAKACTEKAQSLQAADYEYSDPDNPDPAPPVKTIREACFDKERSEQVLGLLTGWDQDFARLSQSLAANPDAPKSRRAGIVLLWLLSLLYYHAMGWILTASALTLGAQFWFETLKDFLKLRAAGKAMLTQAEAGAK
jgi:hypothetical protein